MTSVKQLTDAITAYIDDRNRDPAGAVQVDGRRRGHPGEGEPCEHHFSDTTLGAQSGDGFAPPSRHPAITHRSCGIQLSPNDHSGRRREERLTPHVCGR